MQKKSTLLKQSTRIKIAGYAFITPAILGFIMLTVIPLVFAVALSFRSWNGLQDITATKFVGLNNYKGVLTDPQFHNALKNTLIFTIGMVIGQSLLGFLLALALNSVNRGLGILRSIFFLPSILSMIAMSLLWRNVMYTPTYGAINLILKAFGIASQPFLQSADQAKGSIIAMTIWKFAGYYMILFIAGLKSISIDFYESAKIDGARKWHELWYITLPLIRPTMLLVLVMNAIGSFQVFGPVFMMTMGGPGRSTESVVTLMYKTVFGYNKFSYGTAMSMVLFFIILVITIIQMRLMKQGGLDEY